MLEIMMLSSDLLPPSVVSRCESNLLTTEAYVLLENIAYTYYKQYSLHFIHSYIKEWLAAVINVMG